MSRRYFESLRPGDCSAIDAVPGGLFLTRVERAQYRWHADKPYYAVVFSVIEPKLPAAIDSPVASTAHPKHFGN